MYLAGFLVFAVVVETFLVGSFMSRLGRLSDQLTTVRSRVKKLERSLGVGDDD